MNIVGDKMDLYQIILFLIVFIAVILAIFLGTGGKAWFCTIEKPEKIIGKAIRFCEIECAPNGLLPKSKQLPVGIVIEYMDSKYRLKFLEPFELNGKMERFANIAARHVGYPISSINKFSSVTATGDFESGESFIAEIKRGENKLIRTVSQEFGGHTELPPS